MFNAEILNRILYFSGVQSKLRNSNEATRAEYRNRQHKGMKRFAFSLSVCFVRRETVPVENLAVLALSTRVFLFLAV